MEEELEREFRALVMEFLTSQERANPESFPKYITVHKSIWEKYYPHRIHLIRGLEECEGAEVTVGTFHGLPLRVSGDPNNDPIEISWRHK